MIARRKPTFGVVLPVVAAGAFASLPPLAAQSAPPGPPVDRVLAFPAPVGEERLDVDRGAMGAWHRIRKLATTASLLHITAHPDDEHSGMLTLASRGWGARTALLSLNRGEAGANAIGPELFDALGLIRTRELVLAGRYYGLDDLYFTTAVDYGYSKSVGEAFRSWDREAVLEDMVRVIRLNRPLVVVSRFHGSTRDGHGHHHAAGLLTPEAVAAAADPARFPSQITEEGLRPWRVLRTFRGGVRADEPFDVEVDATGASPWLGDTYQRWASRGLGLQRSQTAGRVRTGGGRTRYEGGDTGAAGRGGASFFADLDTSLSGLHVLLGEETAPRTDSALAELQGLVETLVADFDFRAPERSVPGLVRGLALLRSALGASATAPEARFHLSLKERQFEGAILAARGIDITAEVPAAAATAVLVPGQATTVQVSVAAPRAEDLSVSAVQLADRDGRVLARTSDFTPESGQVSAAMSLRVPGSGRDGATAAARRTSDAKA
ncbi:PIG-L family deacetylase [Candidatus Palauibacter sp.]|uniref:PIG-L family deacetylase n=1 Tax=Candidatus Palauibacter sp. TaxID=3101350 RepID=UPI003AF28D7E